MSSPWQKQSRACHTAGVGKTRVSDGGDGIAASRRVLGRMDGECTSHAGGGVRSQGFAHCKTEPDQRWKGEQS